MCRTPGETRLSALVATSIINTEVKQSVKQPQQVKVGDGITRSDRSSTLVDLSASAINGDCQGVVQRDTTVLNVIPTDRVTMDIFPSRSNLNEVQDGDPTTLCPTAGPVVTFSYDIRTPVGVPTSTSVVAIALAQGSASFCEPTATSGEPNQKVTCRQPIGSCQPCMQHGIYAHRRGYGGV
jgi:hypothetical protein